MENLVIHQFILYDHVSNLNVIPLSHTVFVSLGKQHLLSQVCFFDFLKTSTRLPLSCEP